MKLPLKIFPMNQFKVESFSAYQPHISQKANTNKLLHPSVKKLYGTLNHK